MQEIRMWSNTDNIQQPRKQKAKLSLG